MEVTQRDRLPIHKANMLSTYQLNPVNNPYREVGISFTDSFSSFLFSALEIDIVCDDTNNNNNWITAAKL